MKLNSAIIFCRRRDIVGVKNKLYIGYGLKAILTMVMLLHTAIVKACECPPLTPVSVEQMNAYDVVFTGRIDSISPCATNGISIAHFTIDELYKGKTAKQVNVHFDCISSCMMSLAKNEEWIIYAIYQRFDVISVKLCSHSRKYFREGKQDFYRAVSGRTYDQEKEFLRTNLGIRPFVAKEQWNKDQVEFKPHNKQPSSSSKIFLLLISFGVMILIYILTRKKRRKNG